MTGDRTSGGKDHGPGHVGGTSVEFSVDEVSDPSQAQTDGGIDHQEIGPPPEVEPPAPGIEPSGYYRAQKASVEGHPPVPYRQYLQRPMKIIGGIIEKDVSQSGPHDESHPGPEDNVL